MRTDDLTVELRDLNDGPVTLEVNCDPQALDLADPEFQFSGPVKGEIKFVQVGRRILGRGEISTRVKSRCVRCLGDAELQVTAPVDAIYERDGEPQRDLGHIAQDDQIITSFTGDSINPAPELREAMMVELPSLPLCSPDCRGLCPKCGANLNEGECTCSQSDTSENPWQKQLKSIHLNEE